MSENDHQQALIERLARNELGLGNAVLQGWRQRGCVAHRYRLPLLDAAKRLQLPLDPAAFDAVTVWWRRDGKP